MSDEPIKLSPVEKIKAASNYLRGEIPTELVDDNAFFGKDSIQLLKHHGMYQQDDRDVRKEIKKTGGDRAYSMMIRSKIPGGKMTSDQLLAQLDIADEMGNTTLRITTRQSLQLHGILKSGVAETVRRINDIQMSTLGACGDVNRNVMCCPAPHNGDPIHRQMQEMTDTLAEHLAPRSGAYQEVWLRDSDSDEKTLISSTKSPAEIEPIYGQVYLPRKFKIGVALPEDNCIDIHTQDLGLLAIVEGGAIVGYNLLVGGGMGVTPSAKKTFPALAQALAFVTPEQTVDAVTAVVKVQRDNGNRSDRKIARLKYLVADWGIEKMKAEVEKMYGAALPAPRDVEVHGHDDHIGWFEQGDGLWCYGLNVENGRVKDEGDFRMKAALREICRTLQPGVRLTAHQSLLLTDLEAGARDKIDAILTDHGVRLNQDLSTVRRWSIACPAMPTCGLAVTESERALPGMMDELEQELDKLGLGDEAFTLRMTGCPNGCARPYNSDIGLVGKTLGKYTVFLGGRREGNRLNTIFRDMVPSEEVVPTLIQVFTLFKTERTEGESFGDFCHRQGIESLAERLGDDVAAAK